MSLYCCPCVFCFCHDLAVTFYVLISLGGRGTGLGEGEGGGAEVGGRPKERAERRKERKENKGKQAKYMII